MAAHGEIDPSWRYFTAFHRGLTTTCELCPNRPYVSLQLPDDSSWEGKRFSVRRAVFTTVSHDQGWSSSHPEWNGTYMDSHTGFDISVLDSYGQERVPRESLTQNLRACAKFNRHVITWDFRDNQKRATEETGNLPNWASGMVPSQWVAAIRVGDTIQIVPKANFSCWVNYVAEARIEVWVEAVQSYPPESEKLIEVVYPEYRELDDTLKEIRLITIEPSGIGGEEKPIFLSLQYTALVDLNHVEYEGLSYCWGENRDARKSVSLASTDWYGETKDILVPTNLFSALRRLRREIQPRTVWVDLICINQHNHDERGRQVALLGEIFASATSVSVWLGELDENIQTKRDLDIYRRIANGYMPEPLKTTGGLVQVQFPEHRQTHACICVDDLGVALFFHDRIFLRQYFQRVWVLQEIWNAPAEPTDNGTRTGKRVSVLCGNEELPWWVLMQANMCLYTTYYQNRSNIMPSPWIELFDVPRGCLPPWFDNKCRKRLDILSVLIAGLDMKATDARDKIFALLVFGEETHDIAHLHELVKPNYNKSPSQVYADFTLWWIKEHRSLRILSVVHALQGRTWMDLSGEHSSFNDGDDETSKRPSWTLWTVGHHKWKDGSLALKESCVYRACGDQTIDMSLLTPKPTHKISYGIDWYVPAFRGLHVSTVTSIQPFSSSTSTGNMTKAYLSIFDPTGTSGIWRNSKKGPGLVGEEDQVRNLRLHLEAHTVTGHELPCCGKCQFESASGHVGLCPSGTRVGDLMVILYGGLVPFLLRPKEQANVYSFIGECYIEGLMNGEIFESESRQHEEKIFLLV